MAITAIPTTKPVTLIPNAALFLASALTSTTRNRLTTNTKLITSPTTLMSMVLRSAAFEDRDDGPKRTQQLSPRWMKACEEEL